MSLQEIYNVAMSGYSHLCGLQPMFTKFESTLFKSPHLTSERELLTNEENAQLDVSIDDYLSLLSPYILLVPAVSTLEYLIRRFEIHERNVNSLLRCILPFHETNVFGKILSIMRVSEIPLWKWLLPTSKAGLPLSRKILIDSLKRDDALITFILEMVSHNSKLKIDTRALMTFYGVTITSYLASLPNVTSHIVRLLLPSLFKGLKTSNSDFRNATFMILMEISLKIQLEEDVLDSILSGIAKNVSLTNSHAATKLLVLIFQSNEMKSIPTNSFKFITKMPTLVENIKELALHYNVSKFIEVRGLFSSFYIHIPLTSLFFLSFLK